MATGSGEQESLEIAQIAISERLADTPRRIAIGGGRVFETADNRGCDQLSRSLGGSGGGWLHWLEQRPLVVALSLGSIFLLLWLLVARGVPMTASLIAPLITNQVSALLGEQSLALLDRDLLAPSQLAADEQVRLQRLLDRVAFDASPPVRLQLRQGGRQIGANALALPGGLVVVTDELVMLVSNEEELLALLAHEYGHLHERHAVRQMIQSSLLGAVAVLLTGDASSLMVALPTLLLQLGYSREFEFEADRFAVGRLARIGVGPEPLASLLHTLAGERQIFYGDDSAGYFSTHPAIAERVKQLGLPH